MSRSFASISCFIATPATVVSFKEPADFTSCLVAALPATRLAVISVGSTFAPVILERVSAGSTSAATRFYEPSLKQLGWRSHQAR